MDYAKESLRLHAEWKGKIEVKATVPVETKDDLSLAYTPGVAQPCLEIQKDINKSYDLTRRWQPLRGHHRRHRRFSASATSAPRPACRSWKASACSSRPSATWTRSRSA